MKYVVDSREMKLFDEQTTGLTGIPGMLLMEKASMAVFDEINKYICDKEIQNPSVLIMAGPGNNGGDGLALARILKDNNIDVIVCLISNNKKLSELCRLQLDLLEKYEIKVYGKIEDLPVKHNIDILVDSVFGIGLSKNIEGYFYNAIKYANELKAYKIAIDIPSGINTDTGEIMNIAFKADLTVTFGFLKTGHLLYPGSEYSNRILVKEIGINERSFYGVSPKLFTFDDEMINHYPKRVPNGNKGTFGKVLIVAGSMNMAGAAILSAKACMASGAGMVKLISDENNRQIIQETVPECLFSDKINMDTDLAWGDVCLIGPGIGVSDNTLELLKLVIDRFEGPLIIDADGLNLVARFPALLENIRVRKYATVLTPHVFELKRLLDGDICEIKAKLQQFAYDFSVNNNVIVVAKDYRTFVAFDNKISYINTSGNDGMATAGSGDVLAGIIAGFTAMAVKKGGGTNEDIFSTICDAVYVHGLAGDKAKECSSAYKMTAGDIITKGMV